MFTPTVLGPKEAEMRIIGCDLHARQQTLAVLDTATGEVMEKTLAHSGSDVKSPARIFVPRRERVYIIARACELELGGTKGLQAAGAGGL